MNSLPKHIAFIMDGNGRWAQGRGLKRLEGHKRGVDTVRTVLDECIKRNIEAVTFYAFSSENWRRPEGEVTGLFALMRHYFKQEMKSIQAQNVRVKFIGDRAPGSKLDQDIIDIMNDVEVDTAENTALTATFAINYGARNELTRAATEMALTESEQDEPIPYHGEALGDFLDTGKLPDVDFMVRTGGEMRLSNFLLWQIAYAELYFTDIHWPDFCAENFQTALDEFAKRQRRFGGLPSTPAEDILDDVEEL